jgi:hypothetical protein
MELYSIKRYGESVIKSHFSVFEQIQIIALENSTDSGIWNDTKPNP